MTSIRLIENKACGYISDKAAEKLRIIGLTGSAGLTEDEEKIFCEVLQKPKSDLPSIIECKEVFQDFYNHVELIDDILTAAQQIAKSPKPSGIVYGPKEPEGKLRDAVNGLCAAIGILRVLAPSFRQKCYNSFGMKALQAGFHHLEECDKIENELRELSEACAEGRVEVALLYNRLLKPSKGLLTSYGAGVDVSYERFGKTRRRPENLLEYKEHFIQKVVIGHLIDGNIKHMVNTVAGMWKDICAFLTELARDALFYRASLKVMKALKNRGLPVCFPAFQEDPCVLKAQRLYDVSLFDSMQTKDIVQNDIEERRGELFFISGPNRGGKTTFLRSIGIAQLLAQSGLYVPAASYECSVFKGLLTHFPDEEDIAFRHGKLSEELTELKSEFQKMPSGSLVLLNESFSSTSDREGSEIAQDVLKALMLTRAKVFYVTHLSVLLTQYKNLEHCMPYRIRVSSLTAQENMEGEPTFRVVPGEPRESYDVSIYMQV